MKEIMFLSIGFLGIFLLGLGSVLNSDRNDRKFYTGWFISSIVFVSILVIIWELL